MSHIQNDKWVEAAQENFEDALSRGDLQTAKDIIADTSDAGFENVARSMNQQLQNTPISKFGPPSVDELLAHLERTGKVPPFHA